MSSRLMDGEGVDELRAIADAVRQLTPDRRDPERFHVSKDEIAARLRRLARRAEISRGDRAPPSSPISSYPDAPGGRPRLATLSGFRVVESGLAQNPDAANPRKTAICQRVRVRQGSFNRLGFRSGSGASPQMYIYFSTLTNPDTLTNLGILRVSRVRVALLFFSEP